ncbi:Ankyrin repeat protein [Aspergillus clavatus NRRL 1]|uniref:Ankyrin repeat protein n=1 Tax=Aspergillus clavatus (strain ATCC 1007 / CBS 513.65 / DSM 816 / NCTC 3887 / NRRL 1 / QM 1276 / 107) TaxID=344612 RepID=A1CGJ1_ASPCL|nr:Ankyrin repeat protein [Aspergillus clavatus NRRL 1]EAW11071.1 Ankyrin repeat protein [Aspergillus clavatus NRRL 1]
MDLIQLPEEIFALIVEHLVLIIGNCKAVRLRSVSRRFDVAILHAVFVRQVIDFLDPDDVQTRSSGLPPPAMGRLVLAKSKSNPHRNHVLCALSKIIDALDGMQISVQQESRCRNHEIISEAVAQHLRSQDHPFGYLEEEGSQTLSEAEAFHNIFCASISLGNLSLVKSLLNAGTVPSSWMVNTESAYLGRPLQIACAWGHTAVVKYLLESGADPHSLSGRDAVQYDGRPWNAFLDRYCRRVYRSSNGSSLRAAALAGHTEIVHLLLRPEYKLESCRNEWFRVFLAAARGGHADILMALLQAYGTTWDAQPELRKVVLWEAAYHGREPVVRMMLENGADVNAQLVNPALYSASPLQMAARHGHTPVIRLLLEHGADVACDVGYEGSAVRVAASRGHEEAVLTLLEYGGDPCAAFRSATDGAQDHLLRILLQQGFDMNRRLHPTAPDTEGNSALVMSAIRGCAQTVRVLVEAGVSPNDEDLRCDAVFQAWSMGRFHVYNLLLQLGGEDKAMPDSDEYPLDEPRLVCSGFLVDERTCRWIGKY